MKEWLEEKDMPKDCATCKYYVLNCADTYSCIKQNGKAICCNFSDGMGYRHEDCPLKSLADYTKQVRKEVCEEIYKKCEPLFRLVNNYDNGDVIERNELVDILDQIQGENKREIKDEQEN